MTEPIIAQREVTRHILNRFGIRTQKKLGQHFLVEESVVRRIAESLQLRPDMPVLEIGPGIGTLTQFLAMTGACVTAVELDRRCIEIMGTTLKAYNNIRIVQGDVLNLDFAELMGAGPFQIAGNLPYYITTPIVMKILEGQVPAEKMVFMVQKEVADRMVSAPGSKEYGALSVAVQYHTEAVKLFEVPSAAFMPPPAVDSAVILCTKRAQPRHAVRCRRRYLTAKLPTIFREIIQCFFCFKNEHYVIRFGADPKTNSSRDHVHVRFKVVTVFHDHPFAGPATDKQQFYSPVAKHTVSRCVFHIPSGIGLQTVKLQQCGLGNITNVLTFFYQRRRTDDRKHQKYQRQHNDEHFEYSFCFHVTLSSFFSFSRSIE